MTAADACGSGGRMRLEASGYRYHGDWAQWSTTVPSDMALLAVTIPSGQGVLVNPNASADGYVLRYLWAGGQQTIADTGKNCCGGMDWGAGFGTFFPAGTRWFIIQAACAQSSGCPGPGQLVNVSDVTLAAVDATPPTVTPDESSRNLADENGAWVRGTWNASFAADSQAGVCQAYVTVNGSFFAGQAAAQPRDTTSWKQCGTNGGPDSVAALVDTSRYPDTTDPKAPLTVGYYAADAAQPANVSDPTASVSVDNQPVTLSFSGPTQASSTAGVQHVTATATAGPSGVGGIDCTVDLQPIPWSHDTTESIPVSGLGKHVISCVASNQAVDENGDPAESPTETWTLDIQQPTVNSVSFAYMADALKCSPQKRVVRIPAHWITERYEGHVIRVRVPAQRRVVKVVHCHPRIATRTVTVNGKRIKERVVVLPHMVRSMHQWVRVGRMTKVSGWLGTPSGDALGGKWIRILTEPVGTDLGFSEYSDTTTKPDGSWSAWLPPGPSRLVEAVYDGSDTLAAATSPVATISVRARVSLAIVPRHTHWGSTITITGKLVGGYVPDSGELIVLWIGWKGGSTEIGHVYTAPDGSFRTRYTFLRGSGAQKYRIWAQSARESDYPFQPGSSRRLEVRVT
jgi:hypothetical protein